MRLRLDTPTEALWPTRVRRPQRRLIAVATVALIFAVAASTASGERRQAASASGSSVTVGLLGPLSGARASVGQEYSIGADLAQKVINTSGGVLGHKVNLVVQDDAADPGDAVPAAEKELEVDHVVGLIGPEAITAPVVLPLADRANIPDLMAGGGAEFDFDKDPHFFRMTPSDSEMAGAMVIYAHERGWNRIALAIGNTSVDQSLTPGLVAMAKRLGMTVTAQVTITLGATSFRSEIQTLLSQNPQAILGQFDIPSAGVLFGELQQQGGTATTTPWVVSNLWYTDQWVTAVGASTANGPIYIANPASATGVPAFQAALKKYNPAITGSNDDAQIMWDALNVWALGADVAGTWKWPQIEKGILTASRGPGHVCHDYATCYHLLKKKKPIKYSGAASSVTFNGYHNVFGPFAILHYDSSAQNFAQVKLMTTAEIEHPKK